ncbi:uncharacterized protein LOC113386505 [Ctenocephalides felis]|uniref:uncharacterized protein LOC113386505 n=1 Tax=Ctenocephalides felis TaxID=7515 RepID=UPI000E6E1665|nr:uncharacterized protein LOC113386505 [Ctenocephalides felis]
MEVPDIHHRLGAAVMIGDMHLHGITGNLVVMTVVTVQVVMVLVVMVQVDTEDMAETLTTALTRATSSTATATNRFRTRVLVCVLTRTRTQTAMKAATGTVALTTALVATRRTTGTIMQMTSEAMTSGKEQ